MTAIQVQCALDGAREISIFNIKDAFFERTLQTAVLQHFFDRKYFRWNHLHIYRFLQVWYLYESLDGSWIYS